MTQEEKTNFISYLNYHRKKFTTAIDDILIAYDNATSKLSDLTRERDRLKSKVLEYDAGWTLTQEEEIDCLLVEKNALIRERDALKIELSNYANSDLSRSRFAISIISQKDEIQKERDRLKEENARLTERVKAYEAQTSNPNKENYLQSSNLTTEGMDKNWIELWQEIENWYGDFKKSETCENLLKRMQTKYELSKRLTPEK